ncbi:MAG: GspH/FimT family pseudopilin [Gammaproteobacteria bacterium]|nr:GspH/FimT family pseudopilin [Gammaproteobacteria bacterium]
MKSNGFTLVEIMFCLSITLILGSFAIPSFKTMLAQQKLESVGHTFFYHLQLARTQSISQGKTFVVCPLEPSKKKSKTAKCGKDWSNGLLVFIDYNLNDRFDESVDFLYSKATLDPEVVNVKWRSFRRGKPIRFLPTGITWHNNGTFTLCHSNHYKLAKGLSMTKSGRINLSYDVDNDGVEDLPNNRKVKC